MKNENLNLDIVVFRMIKYVKRKTFMFAIFQNGS